MELKGIPMKKLTIASLLLAAIGTSAMMPVSAEVSDNATQIIAAAFQNADASTFAAALQSAIEANPELAEELLAAAIQAVGSDSASVPALLQAAVNGGLTSDSVTGIAVANNVDAGIASQATAAGNTAGGNTAGTTGGVTNGNTGGNTGGTAGGGGGGGAGGISEGNGL
ncbi:hypothetical protein PTUN_a1810 [Pseudoalteromonas tunicata]|jgi:hypothetical protein|uniref:Orphan protein n=2 Tax=Pseudoalteromonas tunicata TaxID=314281 RepID=A4CBU8_9GAMM|nr:hypothetical protein PTUN_a1810 [Pseudoalteromonas tunicata]EAR27835.1 hypothetical protein PTD2_18475 [Pseudoalteromonas tunicata D2]